MASKTIAAVFAMLFLLSTASLAGAQETMTIDPRFAALGGTHVAWPDAGNVIDVNVAGLRFVGDSFQYTGLSIQTAGPVFDIASLILKGLSGPGFASLVGTSEAQELFDGVYARAGVLGPLSLSFTRNGFGLEVDNDTAVSAIGSGASGLDVRTSELLAVRAGYALAIPFADGSPVSLSIGLGLGGYLSGAAAATTSLVTLPTMLSSLPTSFFLGAPFELSMGGTIDAGVLLSIGQWIAIGVSAKDIYAPSLVFPYDSTSGFFSRTAARGTPQYRVAPLNLSAGAALSPPLGAAERFVQDLTIAIDYRDILDFWLDPANADNLSLKFSVGAEVTLLHVLAVRIGFDRGMIAAGVGLELGMVDLSAAMFGTELATEPGVFGVYNLALGLEFGR